jgi:hypothetical protein
MRRDFRVLWFFRHNPCTALKLNPNLATISGAVPACLQSKVR